MNPRLWHRGRALIREKGKSSGWMADRVEADTTFREGDHVRISVESPRAGYLYVVDRDLFSDGTTGSAMLIYPWSHADNQMRPGRLVDIPAQEDDPSYFTARLTSPNQVGARRVNERAHVKIRAPQPTQATRAARKRPNPV